MYHIVMFVYNNLKMKLFNHISVIFTFIQNEWQATNSRNAILNYSEEYYINVPIYIYIYFVMVS